MPTRRAARERALELAYESEQRGLTAPELLTELPVDPDVYARKLFEGCDAHREEIDALIRKYSEHWALERMPVIDRLILRMGIYELMFEPSTPPAVVIDEALELARRFSTDDAVPFVNGVLDAVKGRVEKGELP